MSYLLPGCGGVPKLGVIAPRGVLEMMGFCADLVQCASRGSGLEGGRGLGVAMAWV